MEIMIEEMRQSLIKLRLTERKFQAMWVYKLRQNLIEKSEELSISEERRSYILHQTAYVHSIEDMASLLEDMKQLSEVV
jgi:hypothetical protein